MGIDMLRLQPTRDPLCDELRTVITFDIHRSATLRKQPPQHLDNILCRDRASTVDSQALPRVFIENCQALQPSSIGSLVMDKVIAPDMIRMRRTGRRGRARAHGASFARFPDDLQPLVLPDAADRLAIHPPLFSL